MYIHFYVRQGKVFVPTVAVTEAGFFLDIEPIAVFDVSDTKLFIQTISRYIANGNPRIPTPPVSQLDKVDKEKGLLKYAKAKSWSQFEKSTNCWDIKKDEQFYHIRKLGRLPKGGWGEPVKTVSIRRQSSLIQQVAERAVEEVLHDDNG